MLENFGRCGVDGWAASFFFEHVSKNSTINIKFTKIQVEAAAIVRIIILFYKGGEEEKKVVFFFELQREK